MRSKKPIPKSLDFELNRQVWVVFSYSFFHGRFGASSLICPCVHLMCTVQCMRAGARFFSVFNKKIELNWIFPSVSQLAFALTAHNSSVWMCVRVCSAQLKWIMHIQFNILDSSVHFIKSNEMNACERARQEPHSYKQMHRAFHTCTQAQSQIALDEIG